jgi:iron complex transport system substrate-binding protein
MITPSPEHPPKRVISLVPSMTESLFDLGFGGAVAGVSDYCIYPAGDVDRATRVGGTKDPRIEQIVDLHPDLILVNQEENSRECVEQLVEMGFCVWMTFPKTIREAIADLWTLVGFFRSEEAIRKVRNLEIAYEWAEMAVVDQVPVRYFCPIWQAEETESWWMTFNRETYMNDLLRLAGGQNIFADRERRYPLAADLGRIAAEPARERDTRYPRLSTHEIISAGPEYILLPTEPYAYSEEHIEDIRNKFKDTPAALAYRIRMIDGSLLTWPGTRLGKALMSLTEIFI